MHLPQVEANTPFRILIVEDDPAIVRLIALPFKQSGLSVFAARDGIEAWEQLAQLNPHLLLTDVKMPRLSGHALIGRVRRVSAIPVLVISGNDSDEAEVQAFKMGADGFVTKPFSPQLLTMRVVACLRRVYSYNGARAGTNGNSRTMLSPGSDEHTSSALPRGFIRCNSCSYVGPEWKFEARDTQGKPTTSCPSCHNKNIAFALG